MKPITYISEQPDDYAKALSACKTLADLKAVTADYGALCADAKLVTDQMSEEDFHDFIVGMRKERKGRFAGEAFAEKYGALMMPEVMFKTSIVAHNFHVPWGLAYIRLRQATPSPTSKAAGE